VNLGLDAVVEEQSWVRWARNGEYVNREKGATTKKKSTENWKKGDRSGVRRPLRPRGKIVGRGSRGHVREENSIQGKQGKS